MNMKKTLALMLALVMVMSLLAGCGGDESETQPQTQPQTPDTQPIVTEPAETEPVETEPEPVATTQPLQPSEVYDPGTALDWNVNEVTNEGYGRTAVTLNNGVTFRVGDPLSDLIAAGMELDEDEAALTLAPWANTTIYLTYTDADGNYNGLDLDIINDAPEARLASDCRIFSVRLYDDGVSLENGLVLGQTTKDEALALFGTDDMYNLVLGTGFNMMEASVSSSDNLVYAVELTYLGHIFEPRTNSDGEDSLEIAVLEHYGIANFEEYANDVNLKESLNISELQVTVADSTLTIGPKGNTMQSLADLGWTLRELDEDDTKLDSGYYLAMFMTPATVNGYEISGFDICNYTDETMDTLSCWLKGIDLENPLYYATENKAAAPFDFYGITADSTMGDVISLLGTPRYAYVYAPDCSIKLTYRFYDEESRITVLIDMTFDFMTNQLVEMSIY